MRSAQTIIKRPLLTEKSARLRETGGGASAAAEGESYAQKVVFEVARDANKIDMRQRGRGAVQGHRHRRPHARRARQGEARRSVLRSASVAGRRRSSR